MIDALNVCEAKRIALDMANVFAPTPEAQEGFSPGDASPMARSIDPVSGSAS